MELSGVSGSIGLVIKPMSQIDPFLAEIFVKVERKGREITERAF